MKKLILFLAVCFAFSSMGKAAVNPPRDQRGNSLTTVDFVGADFSSVDASTGTNPVLILNGRGCVYGVVASSIAATDFVVFRDSNTANQTSSTATVVYAAGTGSNSSGASTTQTFKFPVPIKFTNGICVTLSGSPSTGRGYWTILYRRLNATE